MTKKDLPIPIFQIALLQAYLYEILSNEKECEKDFKYTEWYLKDKFSEEKVSLILKFFRENGLNCDCGVLKKIDLKEIVADSINFHN